MAALLDHDVWTGRLFSDGWRVARGGTAEVREPATGELLGEVGVAGVGDVAEAARRARAAQPGWAEASHEERGAVLLKAAALLEQHGDEIASWIMRETGAIRGKADSELGGSRGELLSAAAMVPQPYGHLLPTAQAGRMSIARRVPFSVVGVITPWNFPLILAMRAVAPALAVGNAVLLKPDVQTPVCGGIVLARLFEEAGLPPGLLHVLPGAAEAGEAVVTDPAVAMISFTGSTATGQRVGELAGRHLKKVSLELGGNNAFIVLDDADVAVAASAGAWGSYLHQGQICLTAGRHLVHEAIADRYAKALCERAQALKVGNPAAEDVALGPIINQRQLDRVDRIVRDTVAAGARVRTGGTHDGLFYQPTVLEGVDPTMRAFTDEIFGPVAPITTFSTDAEAVELANRTEYGLVAGIHTGSMARGLRIANRLRTAMVHVNDQTVNDEAHVPFGGMGASGNGGRYGGQANWDEFTQWQWVTLRDQAAALPF